MPSRPEVRPDGPLVVLLPGMDGTGDLFRPLLEVIPADVRTCVVGYPVDQALAYPDLVDWVEAKVGGESDLVLVAESFSGPVALQFAAAHPGRVRAVVLCASFVRPPFPSWLRWLCRPLFFRLPMPRWVVTRLMVGRDAPESLVRAVIAAVARGRPDVLAGRLRDVLGVDCTAALRDCGAPLLYLAPTRDALLRQRSVDHVRAVRPNVRVRTVDGPHLLLQRRPEAAWREVEAFLKELHRPGGTDQTAFGSSKLIGPP